MLRDQFIQLVESNNQEALVKIIDRLDSIPDEVSPVRELIDRGKEQAIELLINAAQSKAFALESKRVDEEIERFREMVGMQQAGAKMHTLSINIQLDVAKVFSILVEPIYRNAIYMYALKDGEKVDTFLKRYGWEFVQYAFIGYLDSNPKAFNQLWEKWVEGFFKHYRKDFFEKEERYVAGYYDFDYDYNSQIYIESHYLTVWSEVAEKAGKRQSSVSMFYNTFRSVLKKLIEKDSIFESHYMQFFKIIHSNVSKNTDLRFPDQLLKIAIPILFEAKLYLEAEEIYGKFFAYWGDLSEEREIVGKGIVNYIKDQTKNGDVEIVLKNLISRSPSKLYLDAAIEGFKLNGFIFESKKLVVLYECTQRRTAQYAFEVINKLGLEDVNLQIRLFVECLYDTTRLGKIFWNKEDLLTPSLKRGCLNQIIEKLKTLDVDLLKLPGFSSYSPSNSMWSKTIYPSKTVLTGKSPPDVIPMRALEVVKDENAKQKASTADALFKL